MSLVTRRRFLLSAAASAPAVLAQKARRNNLLFIASDDLNTCLSCYGHPVVRTPNIDRIAQRGVRFDRAYCQFPLCSPSRSSIMTGLAPDTTTVYDLRRHFREQLPDVVTLGQLFQRNDYFTGRVGKIFHYGVPGQIGTAGLDDAPTWNVAVNPNGVDHSREEPLLTNYTPARGLGSAICFHASAAPDDQHTDGIVAGEAIRLLEQNRNSPFFIAAGFYRPHVPWIAPSKYFDKYPLNRIDLTRFDEEEMRMAPALAYFTNPAHWGMSDGQRREAMRAYYASIAFLDAQIGKLLDSLDKLGLSESTTIVFWSDHGYQLGEHGQWMKQTIFEAAARVPLLIAGAGVAARGKSCSGLVELLDVYPTAAASCQLKGTPAGLHGASLVPLLARPQAATAKAAITQVLRGKVMGYSIRTPRYRFSMWGDGAEGEELYDYETDPREVKNLAGNDATLLVRKSLRSQLQTILNRRGKTRSRA
jgi:iduronate 2-sulfatase